MEGYNKISTSALDEFKNTVDTLFYTITFYKTEIEDVQEFGLGSCINHNSTGNIELDKIKELKYNLGQLLISELNNNYCNGFDLKNYVSSFKQFINGLSDKICNEWIFNDTQQLFKYKSDFLKLDNEDNLFCNPHFFKPLHSKPFESLLHDLLFAIREINQHVTDITKPLLEYEIKNTLNGDNAGKTSEPCISPNQITALHKLMIDNLIIEKMPLPDFMKCFYLQAEPKERPVYIHGKQNLMIYTMSLIKSINQKNALSNFGIKNYDQMKNRKITRSKRVLQISIKKIMTDPTITITQI